MERGNTRSRRRTVSARGGGVRTDSAASPGAVKLAICAGIFVLAALIKVTFPAFFDTVSAKLNQAMDYKSALTTLGEGLSGERKFTTAVGEAFTYAFRGAPAVTTQEEDESGGAAFGDGGADSSGIDGGGTDEAAEVFGESEIIVGDTGPSESIEEESLTDAIISAFMQTQETYSDYNLPAGVTYEMPALGISYTTPVSGKVTSEFGYREHPVDGAVKFHYGVDISADANTPISAFADGEVIAVGESTTMGNYILISHDGAETKYAHCSEVFVKSGQAVKMGDEIALTGSTGNATSTCLHFELLIGGFWVNPEFYLIKI